MEKAWIYTLVLFLWAGLWSWNAFSQPFPPSPTLRLHEVQLSVEGGRRIVFFRFSQPPDSVKAFALSSPSRLVVDVKGPVTSWPPATYVVEDSLLWRVRVGSHPQHIRFVLDLKTEKVPPFFVEQKDRLVTAVLGEKTGEAEEVRSQVLFSLTEKAVASQNVPRAPAPAPPTAAPDVSLKKDLSPLREEVRQVFFPYRQGPPRIDDLSPGTRLNQNTWRMAGEALPPEILRLIQAGEFETTVQETTNSPLPEAYIEATLKGAGQVQLGNDGKLKNYVAGLPFPLLDPSDSQAGLKAAWNLRYRNLGESVEVRYTVQLRNHTGGAQRSLEFQHFFRYGLHRAEPDANLARWKKERVFYKEYLQALAPLDLAGFQLILLHYDRDTLAGEEWAYDPNTRRVRKTVYNPLAAPLGLSYLGEDRLGFTGYIHPYEWRFRGRQTVLAPWGIKAEQARFGGKGGGYPVDPWELRTALVLECRPRDANHPYGKRVFYLDEQTYAILYVLVYDHQGNHFRTFFLCYGNPTFSPHNAHIRIPLFVGESWIDHKAQVTSVLIPKQIVYNRPIAPKLFTVGNLMRQGK